MKLKHFFDVNLFIALFFSLTCVFFAGWVLSLYDLPAEQGVISTTRLVGGSILGYALLMWFGQHTDPRPVRRAIVIALLIQDVVGVAVSLIVQMERDVDSLTFSSG